jgi:hypothetical protein
VRHSADHAVTCLLEGLLEGASVRAHGSRSVQVRAGPDGTRAEAAAFHRQLVGIHTNGAAVGTPTGRDSSLAQGPRLGGWCRRRPGLPTPDERGEGRDSAMDNSSPCAELTQAPRSCATPRRIRSESRRERSGALGTKCRRPPGRTRGNGGAPAPLLSGGRRAAVRSRNGRMT